MFKNQEEKKGFVKEKFSNVAGRYDLLNSVLSLGIDSLWRKTVAEALRGIHGPFLDVCAGTLPLSLTLARHGLRPVCALDFCFDMLAYGHHKLSTSSEFQHILPVCADAEKLPLCSNQFGGITVAFGVRNLGNIRQGISEMHRVLRPNGKLVILEFSRPKTPVLSQFYRFYLHKFLPAIGGMVSGDRAAYRYLADSIEAFMSPEALCGLLKDVGFKDVTYLPMTFGVVTMYCAIKPHEKR